MQNSSAVFKDVRTRTYDASSYQPSATGMYRLGVDLAKSKDYTVITPFDLTTFQVGPQDAFNQIDYTLQKAKVEAAFYRYNRAPVIMDSTGVGVPIVDDLVNKGIHIVPYIFSHNSRNELLQNLQILLEQDKIKIPDDEELIDQLESAVWQLTPNGRSKVVVPEPKHDDRMMSLALAVWDIPPVKVSVKHLRAQQESQGGVAPMYEEFGI